MSAPSLPVRLQPAARRDVRDLLAYTGKEWGNTQKDIYNNHLKNAFERLSHNPELGPAYDPIGSGLRAYRVQQHIIYYRIKLSEISILRILHYRMNAFEHMR